MSLDIASAGTGTLTIVVTLNGRKAETKWTSVERVRIMDGLLYIQIVEGNGTRYAVYAAGAWEEFDLFDTP